MAVKLKIKKGDLVEILSGKDKGKQGRVIEARPRERRVVVENLNMMKRHTRPRAMKNASRMGSPQVVPGGIIEKPAPVDASNVMIVCPVCNKTTRVGVKVVERHGEMRKVRVCRREECGQEIDK
ncbi:MAG TPA: 50S ribosomal protein L24 [Gaiellaceae bacterium]